MALMAVAQQNDYQVLWSQGTSQLMGLTTKASSTC